MGFLHSECYQAIRYHHLLKTFWTGPRGWSDQQLPDGTIHWTSPTGKLYTTVPGSRLFFPEWDTTTGALAQPVSARPIDESAPDRDLRMPRRRRTRIAENACRVKRERALNDDYVAVRDAERNKPPPC